MPRRNRKTSLLVPIQVVAKLVHSEEFISKLIKSGALQSEWVGGTRYVRGWYLARLIRRVTFPAA